MATSPLRLYAPLLAVVLVQGMFIATAPSTPAGGPQIGGEQLDSAEAGAGAGGATAPGGGGVEDDLSFDDGGGAGAGGFGGGTGSGGDGDGTAGGSGQAGAGDGEGGEQASADYEGDTSHCTDDGWQTDLIYYTPRCKPAWPDGRDNGGATYRGVTGDTIKVLFFREDKNQAVTTILQPQGLRASRQQDEEFMQAAEEFLNKHLEFYGRTLDLEIFDAESCPESPPDPASCRAEARRAAKEDPFMVMWPVPLYPTVFDEFVKEGIIAIGGWNFDRAFYSERRPYRYDVFMDGTQAADFISEYYCKKMAGKPADRAGRIIHPSFPNGGNREQVPRRLGILTPDTPAHVPAARRVQQQVAQCDDREPEFIAYDQDVERGRQQASGNTAKLIDSQVTTVLCMCDPIAPFFRTNDNTRQNYYPEYLLAGTGLIDYDKIGRLYQEDQWTHAFGPSHLARPVPQSDSEATRVWQDSGRDGEACVPCNLPWAYYQLIGIMLQEAGPNLNPLTVERGMLNYPARGGWEESGRRPEYPLYLFGQGDYTALSDIREVYWDRSANSRVDGQPGAYVALNDGRRWTLGSLQQRFDIPQKPQ